LRSANIFSSTFSSFNPTLVRLRQEIEPFVGDHLFGFNPTLVRLRLAIPPLMVFLLVAVSIPRWFD